MQKTITILALFIVFIAGAMLLSGCGTKTEAPAAVQPQEKSVQAEEQKSEPSIGQPWLQVVKDGVFLIRSVATSTASTTKVALKTGDLLDEGDKIETDKSGLANIYFPDGSVARMDSETQVIISSGIYVPNSKTLVVRIKLVVGNLWSKIIKLATPESVWEVRTTNAVAAVRGSAFGMSYHANVSRIIGSEHKITVQPIDPENNSIIAAQEAVVEENKFLDISPAVIAAIAKGSGTLSQKVEKATPQIYGATWINASIEADKAINERLIKFETEGMSTDEAENRYRVEVVKEFTPMIQAEQSSEAQINLLNIPAEETATSTTAAVVEQGATTTEIMKVIATTSVQVEPFGYDDSEIPTSSVSSSPNLGPYFVGQQLSR